MDEKERKELNNRFTYHAPKADQTERYEQLRAEAHYYAFLIHDLCPPSRERSIALTHLDAVVMNANAAIARRE